MALTETRPEIDAQEAPASDATPVVERILSTGDHKDIGRLWIVSGVLLLVGALVVSALAAFEQGDLGSYSLVEDANQYIQLWSAGRALLYVAAVLPILVGLATYLVPLQVGSSELAFSRGAAGAYWTWLLSTVILVVSYIDNGGPAGGTKDGVLLWTVALGAALAAIVLAMVCIATTILGARASGQRLEWVPVSTWAFFVFSLIGIVVLPVVMGQLLLGYLDVKYDYLVTEESRISLIAAMNSISLAPSIYWFAIPVLGLGADSIATQTGRPLRFTKAIMVAIGLLAITSFAVEMFAFDGSRRLAQLDNAILVVGIVSSVLPIIAVLALAGDSVKNGKFALRTPLVGALLSGLLLVVGAVVAVLGAIEPIVNFIADITGETIDIPSAWTLNDTTFHEGVRGFVMGAVIVGLIAAVHNWGHKIWGRSLDDRAGLLSVLAAAAGTVVWGGSLVATGFLEQPYLSSLAAADGIKDGVEVLNLVSGVGMLLVAAGAALLLLGVLGATTGRGSMVEPWAGSTLEWTTLSPPPLGNFAAAPVVTSANPALDAAAARAAEAASTADTDSASDDGDAS